MSARVGLQSYLEGERIKMVHDRVKSASDGRDFDRRGGIEIRRKFFSDLLGALEEYER